MRLQRPLTWSSLLVCCAIVGCAPMIRTEVSTLSDRAPAAASAYRVVLEEDQAHDLEASRLANGIHAQMTRLGFRRVDSEELADLEIRFELYDDGVARSERGGGLGTTVSHRTGTSTSQASVAGVPVPLTRRSTVYHDHGVAVGHDASGPDRLERRYRLELTFADDAGPSHKVTVSTTSLSNGPEELAPCLIEAAFRDFPLPDKQEREVSIPAEDCRDA